MKTMHQTGTRWLVILGLLSWAAPAAGAQPESGAGNTESLESVPADLRITDDPTFAPETCSTGGYQSAVVPRRPLSRIKSRLQYSYWGYPEEFEEIPFGARVRAHQEAQICSGWSARLWLYRYDFCDDGATLNAAGHKRLSELAHEFPVWSHHVLVIEATPGQPQLDAARRAHVEKQLETFGIPAQVVIGVPTISAPFGDETRMWNSLLMKQIQSGGMQSGGMQSGGGSSAAAASGQ
jgi:hypothetical protein